MSVHLKKREIIVKGGRNRVSRPKTFETSAKAEAYAKDNKLKGSIVQVGISGKKWAIKE